MPFDSDSDHPNRFHLPTQNHFTGVARHGGRHIVPYATTSADASARQVNIVYPPERDYVYRMYQGVSVTISAHRISSLDNRELYIAILASREQISYDQLNDAIRGFMMDG